MQRQTSSYQTVKVRNIEIGAGIPKICVPVTGHDAADIFALAEQIAAAGTADLVEWRVDHFAGFRDADAVKAVLIGLRDRLGNLPLLFTFRTEKEGGAAPITPEAYQKLLQTAIRSGLADLVDLELSFDETAVETVIREAHASNVPVIMSCHDFAGTPSKEEILRILLRMQELGADILKIAVMPHSRRDVLTLLAATEEMFTAHANRPLITMAMGDLGVISRVSGAFFGSAVTFGAAGEGLTSAPGQINAGDLAKILAWVQPGK